MKAASRRISTPGIALLYTAVGMAWITLSDTVLGMFVRDEAMLGRIAIAKGLAFVAFTGVLIFLLLRGYERRDVPEFGAPGRLDNLILLVVLGASVPLLAFSVFVLHSRQDERSSLAHLSAIAELKAGEIARWVGERRNDAHVLASSQGFVERLDKIVRGTTDEREHAIVQNRLNEMARANTYQSIELLDASGRSIMVVGTPHVRPPSLGAAITTALRTGEVQMTGLVRDASGALHLDIVTPFLKGVAPAREPVGVAILHIRPEPLLFTLVRAWPLASSSGESLLVRRDGDSVVYLNELRHRPDAPLSLRKSIHEPNLPAAAATSGNRAGTIMGDDYRGVPVLAAFRPVEGTDWHLIAKMDRSEALEAAWILAWWVGLLSAVAATIIGVAIVSASRTQRAAHRIALQAEESSARSQFFSLPFVGMAITSPETKHWNQFNDRLCEILGYPREELATKSWADMTHPDDLQKNVAEFDRVMRGESEGYAMEKRFIRKDGAVIHAEIDVKCVRRPDGSVEHFVTTVQDITERKVAEARILRLSRLYATLSECNALVARCTSDGELFPAICRAAVETGGMKMAWVGIADPVTGMVRPVASAGANTEYLDGIEIAVSGDDPRGRGPTGTAIRENAPFWCDDFLGDPRTAPWHDRARAHGWGASAGLPLTRGGVAVAALTLYLGEAYAFDEETRNLFLRMAADISFALDKIDAEAALRRSEARFRQLFETSQEGIILGAPDGRIFAANPAARAMLRMSEEELVAAGRAGIIDAADGRLDEAVAERERAGRFSGMLVMRRKDGGTFPAELSSTVFQDASGESRTSVIFRDVTERERAEARLEEQLEELRRWNDATLGREQRILELKQEVNALLARSGQPVRYPSAAEAGDERKG